MMVMMVSAFSLFSEEENLKINTHTVALMIGMGFGTDYRLSTIPPPPLCKIFPVDFPVLELSAMRFGTY